jgi:hypothetical protein
MVALITTVTKQEFVFIVAGAAELAVLKIRINQIRMSLPQILAQHF